MRDEPMFVYAAAAVLMLLCGFAVAENILISGTACDATIESEWGENLSRSHAAALSALLPLSNQVRDGNEDAPAPTFGHLTRLENELKGEERRYFREFSNRFDDLWNYFGVAENHRRRLMATDIEAAQVQEIGQALGKALHQIGEAASGLRHRMSPLLPGLEDRKTLEWTPSRKTADELYKEEMEFIRSNIREAENRFLARYSKSAAITEGENILIRLYWVEEMARQVRQGLE